MYSEVVLANNSRWLLEIQIKARNPECKERLSGIATIRKDEAWLNSVPAAYNPIRESKGRISCK